jgi:hypothetical protein
VADAIITEPDPSSAPQSPPQMSRFTVTVVDETEAKLEPKESVKKLS